MNVLIDTSVWVQHFRTNHPKLIELLACDQALTHPMIILELACGTPPAPRQRTLDDISQLHPCHQASMDETRIFIEQEKLYGLGCGLVDLLLLSSVMLTPGGKLWTFDKRLEKLAHRFDVSYGTLAH